MNTCNKRPNCLLGMFCIAAFLLSAKAAQSQTVSQSADSLARIAYAQKSFEGVVLVAQNGNTIYHKAFGYADEAKQTPIDKNAPFAIASITKMMTAIVILQLADEEKLDLHAPLSGLLPTIDLPNGKILTPHHLLLHISGLPNEEDSLFLSAVSPRQFVRNTITKPVEKPGSFNYANIDYVLLGLIIERIEKTDWSTAVQQRILKKCGMHESGFISINKKPATLVPSFSYDKNGTRKKDPVFYLENYYAAGCMYSTASDLLKLDQALYTETLLNEQSKTLLYTSYPEYNYGGYSVWTYRYPFAKNQPLVMERRGGILGNNSVIVRMLESNQTIIILSNTNAFNPDTFGDTKSLKEGLIIALAEK